MPYPMREIETRQSDLAGWASSGKWILVLYAKAFVCSRSVFAPASTTALYTVISAHAVKNIFMVTVFMYVNGQKSSKDYLRWKEK